MGFGDRLFVGKCVELGVIHEKRFLLGKTKKTALLAERRGKRQFVIKSSGWFILGGGVSYDVYTPEEALLLRDALSLYEEAMIEPDATERGDT